MSRAPTSKADRSRPASERPQAGPDQHSRFVELARELGCDDDEAAFEQAVKKVARAGHSTVVGPRKEVAPDLKKD